MAAPAAAEVPVLAYLVVGLLALLAWGVCVALRQAWDQTLGAVLLGLADALNYDKAFVHIHFGGPIQSLDHKVRNLLLAAGHRSQHTAGYFFHGVAIIQGWMARELLAFARDVVHWAEWVQHAHLPKWTKALIYAAFPPALIARLIRMAVDARLPHLGRVVITKVITHVVTRIVHVVKATAGAVAQPLPWTQIFPRIRVAERAINGLRRRVHGLERYAGAAAAVALFVAALTKLGLHWIRCRNVTRAGRRICGMDTSLLDDLLLGTLAIIGTVSVVEFAQGMRVIEDEAVSIMGSLIREWPD